MRKLLMIGAACAVLAANSATAAAEERLWTGVAIGAGAGAIVAGPPGALVGGVIGGVVGGPRLFAQLQGMLVRPRRLSSLPLALTWRADPHTAV